MLTITATGTRNIQGDLRADPTATDPDAQADGTGNTFTLAAPVVPPTGTTHQLAVRSQSTRELSYTLAMTFAVAMEADDVANVATFADAPPWADTVITNDDVPLQIARRAEDGNVADQDVFVFTPASSGLLQITGTDRAGPTIANTQGVLYGPLGQIDTDTDSGPGVHFGLSNIPVEAMKRYALVVTGTADGVYGIQIDLDAIQGSISDGTENFAESTIAATPQGQQKRNRDRYLFNIVQQGTLYLETTGSDIVRGTLYGPDGSRVKTGSPGSGARQNFLIRAAVTPGLYLLEVESPTGDAVTYTLTANFARGVSDEGPDDTDDDGTDDDDTDDDDSDTGGPVTGEINPRGFLEEPSPGSFRSGIGFIRGWVCDDGGQDVEVRLTNTDTNQRTTLTAPGGSSRRDVVAARVCDRRGDDFGFVVQLNFNLLAEGTYTVEAFVGRGRNQEQIGPRDTGGRLQPQTNRFTVVRISNRETLTIPDEDIADVPVPDFPRSGVTTILRWDNASQNFEITDIE